MLLITALGARIGEFAEWRVTMVLVILALVTGLRGARAGVTLDQEAAVVRSLWWTRTIPRRAITHVEPDGPFVPAIKWVSDQGEKRSTPLVFFADSSVPLTSIGKRNRACTLELARHVGVRPSRRQRLGIALERTERGTRRHRGD